MSVRKTSLSLFTLEKNYGHDWFFKGLETSLPLKNIPHGNLPKRVFIVCSVHFVGWPSHEINYQEEKAPWCV